MKNTSRYLDCAENQEWTVLGFADFLTLASHFAESKKWPLHFATHIVATVSTRFANNARGKRSSLILQRTSEVCAAADLEAQYKFVVVPTRRFQDAVRRGTFRPVL